MDEVESHAAVAPSSGRRVARVTQSTSTMGSPDAVLQEHRSSNNSTAPSTATMRMTRRKPPPAAMDFDEEGAASLLDAFPLDVSTCRLTFIGSVCLMLKNKYLL